MRRLTAFMVNIPLLVVFVMPTVAQSPTTTEELLSGMVTEEVEPGVLRIVDDGVRDLATTLTFLMPTESPGVVAGDDGSVWIQGGTNIHTAFPLGGEGVELPPGTEGPHFVTPDGTVWAGFHIYDGERWTERPRPPAEAEHVQLYHLGGTIWAVWPEPPFEDEHGRYVAASERRWTVAHLDGDEWRPLEQPLTLPRDAWVELFATDDGDLWAWTFPTLNRWHDGEWARVHEWDEESAEHGMPMAIGPEGTIWFGEGWGDYSLWAFDGSAWREWSKDESGTTSIRWGMHVAPDGSLWQTDDPDWEWGTEACLSPVRFDGERLDRFLEDACTDSIDVGPDGSVWVLARTAPDDDQGWNLYVITPKAVVGTE